MKALYVIAVVFSVLSTTGCVTHDRNKVHHAKLGTLPSGVPLDPEAQYLHKQGLLQVIKNHINANQLSVPLGNNAICKIEEFESLYPDSPEAAALRNEITDRYLTLALKQLNQPEPSVKDLSVSIDLLNKAKKTDIRLEKMEQVLAKLRHVEFKPSDKPSKQRKVIRTSLSSEAVAARTNVVRNIAKVIADQAIAKQGSIVVYGSTESDAEWVSGVIRSFLLEENIKPSIKTDSSKAWKPTVDIVYFD